LKKLLTLIVLLVFLLVPLESSVQVAHAGLGIITEIIDGTGDGVNGLDEPRGVAVDAAGNVYVPGAVSHNAFKITPGGTITEIIDSAGDEVNGLVTPFNIAVDAAGNVYVAGGNSNNAFKITPGGIITEIIDGTGDGVNGLNVPHGIAVDAAGNVYVIGAGSDNAFKIDTPGTCSTGGTACTITEIIDSAGDGVNGLGFPLDIAVDAAGNVYVASFNSVNAFKIDTPGTCSTGGTACTITEIIDSAGDGVNVLGNPRGIAVDAAGNVYVPGSNSNNAFKITPGGIITEIIDFTGDGVNNLLVPIGIAVDAAGNVYVTGAATNNAFKLESSCGTKTVLGTEGKCVPDMSQVCGAGTIPDFDLLMCFGLVMNAIGGELLEINTVSLLVAAIGTNPVITALVGITIAGVAGQAIWFVHRRKKNNSS